MSGTGAILWAASAVAGTKLIETIVSECTKAVGNTLPAAKDWNAAKHHINTLYSKISSLRNVKTLWHIDQEIDLMEFYHPTKVHISDTNTDTKEVGLVSDLPEDGNVVIQGIVGLGKSTFLRYLGCRELQGGRVVPIFIELRNRTGKTSINDLLLERIERWGFPKTEKVLDFLLGSGKTVLLCDAFDEIAESLHQESIKELEHLAEKYSGLRIIITARPDSSVQKSAHFRIVRMAMLSRDDLPAVINRLQNGSEEAARLIKQLDAMPANMAEIVTTPLMAVLLALSFRASNALPETVSDFYERLFDTLLLRHDASKLGWKRDRKSNLSDQEIKRVFEAFCFYSFKKHIRVFDTPQVIAVADEAVRNRGLAATPELFIEDIKKITSLLIEDGGKFFFIHSSVQEFFCARFLRDLPEGSNAKFYAFCKTGSLQPWLVVLDFLSYLDSYRFAKCFALPLSVEVLKAVFLSIPSEWKSPSKAGLKRLFKLFKFSTQVSHGSGQQTFIDGLLQIPISIEWFDSTNSLSQIGGLASSACSLAMIEHDCRSVTYAMEGAAISSPFLSMMKPRQEKAIFFSTTPLTGKLLQRRNQAIERVHAELHRLYDMWKLMSAEVERHERNNAAISFEP